MGALKPANDSIPYTKYFYNSRQFDVFVSSIPEGTRSVSLGTAAEREWAPKKLVGASPPQAERSRPARC